ncbi:MAG: GAF domain-containing protein [Planctomycetota bacterium]|nr:GAF domain-containing protein [Planctomycetota bacterium]
MRAKNTAPIPVPQRMLAEWQSVVDVMAGIVEVPAGLIMHVDDPNIEVCVSSRSEGNPYKPGDAEEVWGSGLYCETVLNTRAELSVTNALDDPDWKDNPDVKLDMISYLGLPLLWPDGEPFGTVCILDDKARAWSQLTRDFLRQLRGVIEGQLELVYVNHALGEQNHSLLDLMHEIKTLRGILPICSYCKDVRDDEGYWKTVEEYVGAHSEASFTHSICPTCYGKGIPFQGP